MIDKVTLNGSTEVVDITGSKKNYREGRCLRSTDAGIGNFRIYPDSFPINQTYYTIGVYNRTQDRYECSHFYAASWGIAIQAAGTVLPLQTKSGIDRILYGDLVTTGSEDKLENCIQIKKRSNSNYSGFTMTTSDWRALPDATDIIFESLETTTTVKASEAIAADEVDMYTGTTAQQVTDSQGYEDYYRVRRFHEIVVDKGTTGTQTTKRDELFRFDAKDFRYNDTKGLQAKDKPYTSGYMVEEQATKRFTLTPSQTGWEGQTIVNVTPESGSFVIDGFVMEMGKPTESWANGRIEFYNNAEASGEALLDLDIRYENFDGRTEYRVNTYYAGTPYDYSALPGEHAYIPLPTTFTVSQESPLYLKISSENNSWLSAGGYSGSKGISTTTSAWQTSVDMTLRGFDDQEDVTASAFNDLKSTKQDTLVSGTNIKTVNGNSLLGSGNIVISGGGGSSYSAGDGIDITSDVITNTREQRVLTFEDSTTGVKAALRVISPHWDKNNTEAVSDPANDLTFVNNVPAANADPYVQANYLDGTLMEFEVTDYSEDGSSNFSFDLSEVSGGVMFVYYESDDEWEDEVAHGAIYTKDSFYVGMKIRMNNAIFTALMSAMQADCPYSNMEVQYKTYAWNTNKSVNAIHSGTSYPLAYNSDLTALAARVTALETALGNISSALDTINGEAI